MGMDASTPPTYSNEQLDGFYARIGCVSPRISKDDVDSEAGLAHLRLLQKLHMASIPFENLSLHYSQDRHVSTDHQALFRKIVDRRRGGYCFENNQFFRTVLQSLGYQLYAAGARVAHPTHADGQSFAYGGWRHMVILVTIESVKYLVDVGFGVDGAAEPLVLRDGELGRGPGTQSVRLRWANIPQNTDSSQRLWVLEARRKDSLPWKPDYCFTETEFIPQDLSLMNYAASTARDSFFTYKVMCLKTIMEGGQVIGNVTLFEKEVKETRRGETKTLMICETEKQRVLALQDWFGIHLTDDEQRGIEGTVTQLKGK